MNNAPSVVYPVGRCAFQGGLLVALGGVSGAVGLLFLAEMDFRTLGVRGWLPGVAASALWLIWMTWALLSWRRSPQGSLRWEPQRRVEDGINGAWSWTDRAGSEPLTLTSVERVLDLQGCILLRLSERGERPRWAWIERSSSPARWNDLRRALVSSCA